MSESNSRLPSLIVCNGEFAGRVVELDRDVFVIGRAGFCDLVLKNDGVSREHARVFRDELGYQIVDSGSKANTRVDDVPIKGAGPVRLKDNSEICIFGYKLVFKDPKVTVTDVEEGGSTILGSRDVSSSQLDPFLAVKPEEKLRGVLEISRNLGAALHLEEVLDKTLETLFSIFPQADRGFVILKEQGEIDLTPRAIRQRRGDSCPSTISRTILEQVMKEGKAILSINTRGEYSGSKSLHDLRILTMMCAPLLDQDGVAIGILQLDSREERGRFTQDDLDLLVAVAVQAGVVVENTRLHRELRKRIEIDKEARSAREVQLALLPTKTPDVPGYDFWHYYEPAAFVGGDYYDYLPILPADPSAGGGSVWRWGVAVGDVAGKGMPAALLMVRFSMAARLLAPTLSQPRAIVERLDHEICESAIEASFITFILAVVDVESHRLTTVNAGHPRALIRRGDGRIEEIGNEVAGVPLGVLEEGYHEAEALLGPGDLVVLLSDGVPDAINESGEFFGMERLLRVLRDAPGTPAGAGEAVIAAVRRHAAGYRQYDDITLVCFGRPRADETPATSAAEG